MYTKGAQCTGNFVFTDGAGRVYVGYAAHCAGKGAATDTDGCDRHVTRSGPRCGSRAAAPSSPRGPPRPRHARLQLVADDAAARHDQDAAACAFNDFALVRVATADVGKVNPSVPFWGGPTGIRTDGAAAGDQVYSYGNSSLRGRRRRRLAPRSARALGDHRQRLVAQPSTPSPPASRATPAAASSTRTGRRSAPSPPSRSRRCPAANGVGDLDPRAGLRPEHSGIPGLRLVQGTEPFVGLG